MTREIILNFGQNSAFFFFFKFVLTSLCPLPSCRVLFLWQVNMPDLLTISILTIHTILQIFLGMQFPWQHVNFCYTLQLVKPYKALIRSYFCSSILCTYTLLERKEKSTSQNTFFQKHKSVFHHKKYTKVEIPVHYFSSMCAWKRAQRNSKFKHSITISVR